MDKLLLALALAVMVSAGYYAENKNQGADAFATLFENDADN